MYAFAPEKPPSLVGRNFCLAILRDFAKALKGDAFATKQKSYFIYNMVGYLPFFHKGPWK
jgi:hypothetical protein